MLRIFAAISFFFGLLTPPAVSQDCLNPTKYQEKMWAADSCIAAGNYSLANDNYNAAAVYCRDSTGTINRAKDELFGIINGLRTEADEQRLRAETRARIARANEIAAQGEIALREGDRTSAFQLGAFAHTVIDSGNHAAVSVMSDAYYYNDDPERNPQSPALSWSRSFIGHTDLIKSVAFSPNGKYVLTGSWDNTAKLWDAHTGREIYSFNGHTDRIFTVAFSHDGQYAITGSSDETVKIWDVRTGRLIRSLKPQNEQDFVIADVIYDVVFSPDDRYVITNGRSSHTKLWSVNTGLAIDTIPGYRSDLSGLHFTPDQKFVIAPTTDGHVIRWEIATGKIQDAEEAYQLAMAAYVVTFSPDKKYAVYYHQEKTATLWNSNTQEKIYEFAGHSKMITDVAFSRNGQYLITGGLDYTARVWDVTTGKELQTLRGHTDEVHDVVFSPDNRYAVTAGKDNTARLWKLEPTTEAPTFVGHDKHINCAAISPDGRYLATGSSDKTTRVWDIQSGTELYTLQHDDDVNACVFSPDGQLLLTAASNNNIRLWSVPAGREINRFPGSHRVRVMAFTADGEQMLFESSSTKLRRQDLATGKKLGTVDLVFGDVLAYSHDRKHAVVKSNRYDSAKLLDIKDGHTIQDFRGHTENVRTAAFSPDDQLIVTGSEDFTAKLWKAINGQEVRTFNGHKDEIETVAFTPDERYVLTGSKDNTAKLWDVETGYEIREFNGHSSFVWTVVISADGSFIVTGSWDNTAKLWLLRPKDLLKKRQNLTGFSAQQILRYDLHRALEEVPGAWIRFLTSSSWQQLHSFALFYTQQAANNNNRSVSDDFYKKAQTCYFAARQLTEAPALIRDEATMLIEWAHKLRFLEDQAAAAAKAREAILCYQQLTQKTTLYNVLIKSQLEGLVEQGLEDDVVRNFLSQLK